MINLTRNEKATLILSLITLALSIVTIYYQFFFVSHELKATFVDWTGVPSNDSSFQIALSNSGNRQTLVTNLYPTVLKSGGGSLPVRTRNPIDLPIIVNPGETRLLPVSLPIDAPNLYMHGETTDPEAESTDPDTRRLRIALHINVMDSNGKTTEVESQIVEIYISRKKLISGGQSANVISILN